MPWQSLTNLLSLQRFFYTGNFICEWDHHDMAFQGWLLSPTHFQFSSSRLVEYFLLVISLPSPITIYYPLTTEGYLGCFHFMYITTNAVIIRYLCELFSKKSFMYLKGSVRDGFSHQLAACPCISQGWAGSPPERQRPSTLGPLAVGLSGACAGGCITGRPATQTNTPPWDVAVSSSGLAMPRPI